VTQLGSPATDRAVDAGPEVEFLLSAQPHETNRWSMALSLLLENLQIACDHYGAIIKTTDYTEALCVIVRT
jgi:hypothetical protein